MSIKENEIQVDGGVVNTGEVNTGSNKAWSFHAGGGIFGAPIARGLGSESVTKLTTALQEIYKNAVSSVEITILTLDNVNEPALAFSSVIVALRMRDNPQNVAYHILLVEATGDKISPLTEQIGSQQVEIMRLTGDAMDSVLRKKAGEVVKKAFPNSNTIMVDGCVIPRNFNFENKEMLHRLALNAGLATGTELEIRRDGFKDLNIASTTMDSNLVINIGFNHQSIEDAVGEPMRSDVLVNFSSQLPQAPGQQRQYTSVNSANREQRIAEASAFIDLVWAPVAPQVMNPWTVQQQQQMQTQKYVARCIITNLVSSFSYTPASILMALVSTMTLRDDNTWIQSFRPVAVNTGEIDYHDIGAMNIEANLANEPTGYGTRIDTKSETFRLEDLGQYVAAIIRPGLVMSLDVPECGPQTWYMSVFAGASNGSKQAYDTIYAAAQELTNGHFGRYFNNGSPMFTDTNNRIHSGYWVDRNGTKRDIRDFDMVAVANIVGDRNPQYIREWSDTFTRVEYPLSQRLAARKKMIIGLSNETAEFTGFLQRVTFTSTFMDALVRGCADAGLKVRVNTPLSAADFSNRRGVAGFIGDALVAPGQTFGFYGGYIQQPGFNPGGAGWRW